MCLVNTTSKFMIFLSKCFSLNIFIQTGAVMTGKNGKNIVECVSVNSVRSASNACVPLSKGRLATNQKKQNRCDFRVLVVEFSSEVLFVCFFKWSWS